MRIMTIDSQILSALMLCEEYANLSFIKQKGPETRSLALDNGDLMHVCLESYYTHRFETPDMPISEAMELAAQKGQEHSYGLDAPVEDCLMVIKVFKQYVEYRKDENWTPICKPESVFSKVMYEDSVLKIIYVGKIDLIVDAVSYAMVVDNKTTTRRQPPIFLNNQFLGYCWAMEVNNICINEIGFQKTLKPEEKFRRHTYSYDQPRINEWVTDSVFYIKEFAKRVDEGYFPHRITSCRSVYGDCLFLDVCRSDPDGRDWKLRTQFVEKIWDVSSKLGETNE